MKQLAVISTEPISYRFIVHYPTTSEFNTEVNGIYVTTADGASFGCTSHNIFTLESIPARSTMRKSFWGQKL